jgi:hypothetical protein
MYHALPVGVVSGEVAHPVTVGGETPLLVQPYTLEHHLDLESIWTSKA